MLSLLVVLIPICFGLLLPFLNLQKSIRNLYCILVSILVSLISFYIVINNININFIFIRLNGSLNFGFKIDGLSKIFIMMISILWPLAVIYATEYMSNEHNVDSFFRYYLIAYGITLALSMSRNLITMYFFYELLTFLTLPLVMHNLEDKKTLFAGKLYLVLSIFGASLVLIGIIMFIYCTSNIDFVYGGLLDSLVNNTNNNLLYISYILCFIGFGVKTAIIPFTVWLPVCSVAPTPVSALLHAVAVVKAGVFAIMRITYYIFGIKFLDGSFVQIIVCSISIITIIYGSIMAVKETHIKRRLAYSTASNLSYILFAITLMTVDGYVAGLTHMLFHAIIKIALFFCAGSIMIYSHKEYVSEVKGLSAMMPMTMFTFLVSSLALIGVPLTCGFISKYNLIISAIKSGTVLSYVGIFAIILSTILTTIYLFSIVINAYMPFSDVESKSLINVCEAGFNIKFSFIIIIVLIIYFGINSNNLLDYIIQVAQGL